MLSLIEACLQVARKQCDCLLSTVGLMLRWADIYSDFEDLLKGLNHMTPLLGVSLSGETQRQACLSSHRARTTLRSSRM